jgi:hypothetical protein
MTDRERWTIYPLLFLTLGIAVKDRIIDTVQCGTLVVRDRQGHQQIVIEATPQGGLIRADAGKSQIGLLLGHTDRLAGLMFIDAQGKLHSPSLVIQTPDGQGEGKRRGRADGPKTGGAGESPSAADEAKTPTGDGEPSIDRANPQSPTPNR